jgi:hypothetical protein
MKALLRHPIILAVVIAQFTLMTTSSARAGTMPEQATMLSSGLLFDYLSWTLDAAWQKAQLSALGMPDYLTYEQQKFVVYDYIQATRDIESTETELDQLYADPAVEDKESATEDLRIKLSHLTQRQKNLAPFAEAIIQGQVASVVSDLGLTTGGQPIPTVLYHVSPLPLALIISPRDKIQQEGNISLLPDLTVEQRGLLEEQVDSRLDVSSLIVPVGGIGAYPTMVMRTSDLRWLTEVVAHEWIHNFLTLRPLGIRYGTTPELRTMNETTASIAGKEIGMLVIESYYPELLSTGLTSPALISDKSQPVAPGSFRLPFDFRKEMHETRVTTDQYLLEGKVLDAEKYMEARRQIFWDNGYPLRKLNQAYFAFYGAYADIPGGPAGEDPVGPAVRKLREQSASLADFIFQISRMTSFEDLLLATGN